MKPDIDLDESMQRRIAGCDTWFRNLFESANDSILVISGDRFVDCNPKTEELFGCAREEILRRSIHDFSPAMQPDGCRSRSKAEEKIQAALSGRPQIFGWTCQRLDGTAFDVEISLSRMAIDEEPALQAIVRDVTHRRRAEEALRESEERYRNVYTTAPLAFVIWDCNCKVTGWNNRAQEMFGWSRDEVIGMNFFDFLIPENARPRVQDVVQSLLEGRIERDVVNENLTKDGEIILCRWNNSVLSDRTGKTVGAISLGLDITEQKRAEKALRESEERFRALTEKVSDIVIIMARDGTFGYVSPSVRAFGYKPSDMIGKTWKDFAHPDDLESIEKPISLSKRRHGKTVRMSDFRIRHKDGSWPLCEGFLTCLFDQPGVSGIVFNGRDISEKRRLQELASRAQRLETAGRIAGQVAHDFNNLLGPLVAYPDFIVDELPDNHSALAYVKDMKEAAGRMSEINQQLLTLGRRGHYNQEPLNLNEIVNQALNQIYPVPPTLIIDKNLEENLMNVMGGGTQILRAVLNLISNARDAMRDSGLLTIRTENMYVDVSSGRFADIRKGEYVKLTISDTGCGLSPDILPRIFDPFFSTKKPSQKRGSGLGLSVVHAVVEDHKGCIDYESTPGVGTSFYIYLPTTREKALTGGQEEIVGGAENVLVVDDDRVQREVNGRLLERLGYKVHVVSSGEDALEFILDNPQDLMILDMIMPDGIDGTETLRQALSINPAQKAVVMSGYAESVRVEEALSLGASSFIRKPLTLEVLARAVREALDPRPRVKA